MSRDGVKYPKRASKVGGFRTSAGRRPAHDTATDTEWQLPEVVLIQFVSPDDEHELLETCREL
jgi:hypothetical protein